MARGAALLEAVVGIALTAGASVMAFAAVTGALRSGRGLDAAERLHRQGLGLAETLKNYATPEPSAEFLSWAPHGSWHLEGDACTRCAGGRSCYALEPYTDAYPCLHDVTSLLDGWLRGQGAALRYRVLPEAVDPARAWRVELEASWGG